MKGNNYVYFWGARTKSKHVGVECLSQWYPTKFSDGVNTYTSTEQYMMYHKAMLFGSYKLAGVMLDEDDPKTLKALGRKVQGFRQPMWDTWKEDIVYKGNTLKFSQNPALRAFLISFPDDTVFVEASPYDSVWGIGLRASDPRAWDSDTWQGENLLGHILTRVANELRE